MQCRAFLRRERTRFESRTGSHARKANGINKFARCSAGGSSKSLSSIVYECVGPRWTIIELRPEVRTEIRSGWFAPGSSNPRHPPTHSGPFQVVAWQRVAAFDFQPTIVWRRSKQRRTHQEHLLFQRVAASLRCSNPREVFAKTNARLPDTRTANQRPTGTSRFNSSLQFRTTTICVGRTDLASSGSLIMRKRWPSEATSYVPLLESTVRPP